MRLTLLFLFCLHFIIGKGQDARREELKKLCTEFDGRGYVNNGALKAADYLAQEFEKAGLKPLNSKSYFQSFSFQVNTFPSKCDVRLGSKELVPGTDFLVKAVSSGAKGKFSVLYVGKNELLSDSAWNTWTELNLKKHFIYIDTMSFEGEVAERRYKLLQTNALKAKGLIFRSKRRLLWTVGRNQANFTSLEVAENIGFADQVKLNIKAKLEKNYPLKNVIGYVPGTSHPDSFLFVTAHYDHLGKMGSETVFPGANDNASGTIMMLELARYYAKNPIAYSICFVAFTGEEAGLVGSKYFTEHPSVPLNQIRFLMNLDLEGTGSDGITAVNATIYKDDFELLKSINSADSLLKKVAPRGKAANSDHYWFGEAGVPCFFIYQMGSYDHYHDPGDNWDILPMDHFDPTIDLIKKFFLSLSGK